MAVKSRYRQAMEALYLACIVISGVSLVVITLIIPYGVFMRYVLNAAPSWPEPAAVVAEAADASAAAPDPRPPSPPTAGTRSSSRSLIRKRSRAPSAPLEPPALRAVPQPPRRTRPAERRRS